MENEIAGPMPGGRTAADDAAYEEHRRLAGMGRLPLTAYELQVARELHVAVEKHQREGHGMALYQATDHLSLWLMTHRAALLNTALLVNGQPLIPVEP